MATIRKELRLQRPASEVWDALRDFGAVHTKLARGFVVDTELEEGGRARRVTFADGNQAREWLVSNDEGERRLVYAITESPRYSHYSASAQVFEDGDGSRFVWTVDFLPDDMASFQDAGMEAGLKAMGATLS